MGRTTEKERYYIASLALDYAGYPHALEHRELYLHWQLYVTFNEDTQCKCRNTAYNFSWL